MLCPLTAVLLAPNVQIHSSHPLNAKERNSGKEFAKPITIGDDVWLGGAIICRGYRWQSVVVPQEVWSPRTFPTM